MIFPDWILLCKIISKQKLQQSNVFNFHAIQLKKNKNYYYMQKI